MAPARDADEALRLRVFVIAACLYAVLGLLWGVLYLSLGLTPAAWVPLGYAAIAPIVMLFLARSGAFASSRLVILGCWLVLPLLLQMALGGFVGGSVAVLWSLAAPVAALMFASRREAFLWFIGFLVVVLVAWLVDPRLSPAVMPSESAMRALFALNLAGVGSAAFLLLLYLLIRLDEARAALHAEQERSESLLRNVLPETIVERLKGGERVIAERLDEVSIVFSDLVGFTPLSEALAPERVVEVLDDLFSRFDELVDSRGLEKIRTIGDAYMVVAGAPVPRPDHVVAAADMALALREAAEQFVRSTGLPLEMRIGIDSGPVVAGVIGRRKFVYDVWGDAVNTASRMESHGVSGRIQVTARVAECLAETHLVEPRGVIDVKGKGPMSTFFIVGRTAVEPADEP